MSKNRKGKLQGFGKFLAIYAGALAVIIVITLFLLYGLLKDYEEGRPSSAMDKIVSRFDAANVESLLDDSGVQFSEFEDNDVVANYLKDKISSETVTYKKKNGEYSETNPVYVVYAGDTAIAKATLVANGTNAHKFTKWKLGDISFADYSGKGGNTDVIITAPKGSVVKINDVVVGQNYITEDDVQFSPCKHVSDFVTAPTMTKYTIAGILTKPNVTATFNNTELAVSNTNTSYNASYPGDDALLAQQQSNIKAAAENYGKYIINRLSLTTLSNYMVGYAKDYVSDVPAIWAFLYGKSYTYEFQNESFTNFTKYSDSCFSVDIYYDLYVNWSTGDTTYNTSLTYTFVKTGNNWYVADFIIN